MSVDLTALRYVKMVPMPVTFGRVQRTQGGAFRTDRLGNRWAFQCETGLYAMEPEGRNIAALFDDADRLGGLFAIWQPDFNVGAPGLPVVSAATASGRLLPIEGLTPHYSIRRGQWLSVIVDDQRFLDKAMDPVIADASGNATVRLNFLIRKPIPEGATVELAVPKIEGSVEFDPAGWGLEGNTSFAFTVAEDQ